jgi:outer membrane protein OmpA-like peptidoglycan-associated protein
VPASGRSGGSGAEFDPTEADHDGDGIGDLLDLCPDASEDGRDPHPYDGCPRFLDPTRLQESRARMVLRKAVKVAGDRVTIDKQVLFVEGSANIDPASNQLLAYVAQTLKEHADIDVVEVAGHADKTGNDADNKKITQQRAASVMQRLIANGVAGSRLRAAGYGSYCPVDPGDTPAAYAKNRRVDFIILRRGGKDTATAWGGCDEAKAKGMAVPVLPPVPPTPPPKPVYVWQPDVLFHQCWDDEEDCRLTCEAGSGESCSRVADKYAKSKAEKITMMERACTLGSAWHNCTKAAEAYANGDGVPKDPARALAVARKGCEFGDPFSCASAGDYVKESSLTEALSTWRAACDKHVGLACGRVTIYDRALNEQQKLSVLMKACLYDSASCQGLFYPVHDANGDRPSNLSLLPRDQLIAALHGGCEQDSYDDLSNKPCDLAQKAGEKDGEWKPPVACSAGDELTCIDRCTKQGDWKSCLETSVAYLYGIREPYAPRRAEVMLSAACQGKYDPKAASRLIENDLVISPPDPVRLKACVLFGITRVQTLANFEADDPWRVACKAGDAAGCAHDASYQIDQLAHYDEVAPPKGLATLDKLCSATPATSVSAWACAEASRAVKYGYGADKDEARAKSYRGRACAAGLKRACGG